MKQSSINLEFSLFFSRYNIIRIQYYLTYHIVSYRKINNIITNSDGIIKKNKPDLVGVN